MVSLVQCNKIYVDERKSSADRRNAADIHKMSKSKENGAK